jgi:hypothetical protein
LYLRKALCGMFARLAPHGDMDEYRALPVAHLPKLLDMQAIIPRYGLTFAPWREWPMDGLPWWTKYNKIKHQRDRLFHEDNLRNALCCLRSVGWSRLPSVLPLRLRCNQGQAAVAESDE